MVQNIDEIPSSSSLDKHRTSTLHLEASASGPATIQTGSVDAIPTEHTAITTTSNKKTSITLAKQYDAPPEFLPEATKE